MSPLIFAVALQKWCSSLFGELTSRPILEELRRRGNEKCYHRQQLCGIPDTDSESDSINIEVEFAGSAHNGIVLCG